MSETDSSETFFGFLFPESVENPFWVTIKSHIRFARFTKALEWMRNPATFMAGVFLVILYIFILAVSIMLLPYGLIYVFCSVAFNKISDLLEEKVETGAEYIALRINIILVTAVFIVLLIPSIPLLILIAIGSAIANDPKIIGKATAVLAIDALVLVIGLII